MADFLAKPATSPLFSISYFHNSIEATALIQEAFVETDWEEGEARQLRDQRAVELQEQGYDCTSRTLYRVLDGIPVYLVEAHKPEPVETTRSRSAKKSPPRRRDDSSPRRVPEFEAR